MNPQEILNTPNNPDFNFFLDLISSFPREESIMACFRVIRSMRHDLVESNGINFADDELDFAVKHQYAGTRLEFAQKGLEQKLKYLVGVCIYGEPEKESVNDVFSDVRRILTGKLHLVNFAIEDPVNAAEVSRTLATLRQMHAHKELEAAMSGDKDAPLSS